MISIFYENSRLYAEECPHWVNVYLSQVANWDYEARWMTQVSPTLDIRGSVIVTAWSYFNYSNGGSQMWDNCHRYQIRVRLGNVSAAWGSAVSKWWRLQLKYCSSLRNPKCLVKWSSWEILEQLVLVLVIISSIGKPLASWLLDAWCGNLDNTTRPRGELTYLYLVSM